MELLHCAADMTRSRRWAVIWIGADGYFFKRGLDDWANLVFGAAHKSGFDDLAILADDNGEWELLRRSHIDLPTLPSESVRTGMPSFESVTNFWIVALVLLLVDGEELHALALEILVNAVQMRQARRRRVRTMLPRNPGRTPIP